MKKQSIIINYILNTIYQILTLITPLITAPYISRVLGVDGVGIYSYTNSVVSIFVIFAVLGTTVYGQRKIAQCRDDRKKLSKNFWEIEILSISTTLVSISIWLLFIALNPQYRIYYLILTCELIATAFDIIWFYNGLEEFKIIVLRNVVIKILSIILLFILVKEKNHVWIYISIMTLGKLLGNISMWIPLHKYVDFVRISKKSLKCHFRETFSYFIPTIAASIYTYLDKVMIGLFTKSTVENGYYEQAQKIIGMAYTILISINTVMSSRMSYLFAQKNEIEIKEKFENVVGFLLTIGIPLTFGIGAIATNFVSWFFGNGYEKVAILMIISCPLILILSFHNFLSSQYLIPSGQRKRSTKGVIIGAVVNLVINIILIPKFQSIGAIISTLIAESTICIVYFFMSKKYITIKLILKYLPKQLFASIIMTLFILILGWHHKGDIYITILQIILGCVIYFIILFILKEKFIINLTKKIKIKILKIIKR